MFSALANIYNSPTELKSINVKLDRINEEINTLKILIDHPDSMIKCLTNMYLDIENIYKEAKEAIIESNKNLFLIQQDINDIFYLIKQLSNKNVEDFGAIEII